MARKAKVPRTPEESENMMINLAVALAEKQLRDGTASPSTINHYLKLAGERDKLEREKLRQETELVKAKAESIASAARTEELVKEAVDAMRRYSGETDDVFCVYRASDIRRSLYLLASNRNGWRTNVRSSEASEPDVLYVQGVARST